MKLNTKCSIIRARRKKIIVKRFNLVVTCTTDPENKQPLEPSNTHKSLNSETEPETKATKKKKKKKKPIKTPKKKKNTLKKKKKKKRPIRTTRRTCTALEE